MAIFHIRPGFDGPPSILGVDYGDLAEPINSPLAYVHDIFEHLIPGFGFNAADEVRAFGGMVYCRRDPAAWLEQYLDHRPRTAAANDWALRWGQELARILPDGALQRSDMPRRMPPRPIEVEAEEMLRQIAVGFRRYRVEQDPPELCLHLLREGWRRARRVYGRTPRHDIASGMSVVCAALHKVTESGRQWSATIRVSAANAGRARVQILDE